MRGSKFLVVGLLVKKLFMGTAAGDVGAARNHLVSCDVLFRPELGRLPDPGVPFRRGRTPEPILVRLLGEAAARHLTELSHGVDERDVVPYEPPKSVGHEETFERDLDDDREILREILLLTGRVATRLRAARSSGSRRRS